MSVLPITPTLPTTRTPAPAVAAPFAAPLGAHPAFAPRARVAPPAAPAAVAGALDAVARLFDFPGIRTGDAFDVAKGSKVGFFGVTGTADVLRMEDDAATFRVKAGAFGVKVDLTIDVVRTGPDTVHLSSRGSGMPDQDVDGRVFAQRTNYLDVQRVDDPSQHTVISHDGNGTVTIDSVVPTFGNAHLILKKRA